MNKALRNLLEFFYVIPAESVNALLFDMIKSGELSKGVFLAYLKATQSKDPAGDLLVALTEDPTQTWSEG